MYNILCVFHELGTFWLCFLKTSIAQIQQNEVKIYVNFFFAVDQFTSNLWASLKKNILYR